MWILLECRQKKLMIKKKALKIKKTPMSPMSEVITHEGNSWNISLYSYNTLGESDASSTVSSGITESFGTQQRGLDFKTLWSDISNHEYFGINFYLVWEIATKDLSILKEQFNTVLKDVD